MYLRIKIQFVPGLLIGQSKAINLKSIKACTLDTKNNKIR